jgi:hypothetical protein
MADTSQRLDAALGAMASLGPRNLREYLKKPAPDFEDASSMDIDAIINLILSDNPNQPARLKFSNLLRKWDNEKDALWTNETLRNTGSRRSRIYDLLKCDSGLAARIDSVVPFYHLDEPVIVSLEHVDWYKPAVGIRDYYWRTYVDFLGKHRGWTNDSLLNIDNSTRAIVECLADPESAKAYKSRGLVMGYVQSGKTANFTGVVARAADAGYRLIIVLAGTWNILRNQTQRRFDKDLLGKELLKNDELYSLHQPPDWGEFLEHGTDPVELGQFAWQRLTRPDIDFRRLKAAIDNLEFEKREKALPIYHASNLHALPVKLLVVKKLPEILANLARDLNLIRTNLKDLPTLVIDDESDQAGLNTVDPKSSSASQKERSKTNLRIVELLNLFPRGQYVGYTATPYANALVDPSDPEDLFPKDFIVSLDRPVGYMGISDFFDPDVAFEDLDKTDYSQKEIAYIRRVKHAIGQDEEDLKRALRSFVLAGALKLYRLNAEPNCYKLSDFRHHTMLIHTSQRTGQQASLAERLSELWNQCVFNSPVGSSCLEELWREDYMPVCKAQGNELVPTKFSELVPHLSEALKRIEKGPRIFIVVNSDTSEAPDFSAAPVWKIVVGGNKLSRGYTVEGLTVSYYRRVSGTADTLMQMGRWFGFRPGYRDLVRVFLGVNEGKAKTDLVALFKQVCRMEELFRDDIKRYVRQPGSQRITPRDIPPMIEASGDLPPTARNKMFNAVLASKNFGGRWSMPTKAPVKEESLERNIDAFEQFLGSASSLGRELLGGIDSDGKEMYSDLLLFESSTQDLLAFIEAYRWLESEFKYPERPAAVGLQIEFLRNQKHGIESWLVTAPQRKSSFGKPLSVTGVGDLNVKNRQRIEGKGFQVFGEPVHRHIAEYLAEIGIRKNDSATLATPNEKTRLLKNQRRGICLIYPVREQTKSNISIGFEILYPENDLPFGVKFTVRRPVDTATIECDAQ